MKSSVPKHTALSAAVALAFVGLAAAPTLAQADMANPNCPEESVYYDPGHGEDIIVPKGFKIEPFITGLNFPTDIAFVGNKDDFKVYVLESGTGLPSRCNSRNGLPADPAHGIPAKPFPGDPTGFGAANPFTPDILGFDSSGRRLRGTAGGPFGKPTGPGNGFQPDGPAIGLAFEHDFSGGTLFATDSNQGVRGATSGGGNNTSRIVKVDLARNTVSTLIHGLPTGDHPTEQVVAKDGWLYWSQGSATNSGVTGHDNGGGGNQHEIACQKITLSDNLWDSGDGHLTSGYSNHNVRRPGAVVSPFEDATSPGMCTGAILSVRIKDLPIDPRDTRQHIWPVAWGFRNPYGIRFSPADHPLKGQLMYSENGEDERGARPTNNAPDRLGVARQNADGTPEWHGWPDRFGFLDSTQAVFNPTGLGPADDNGPAVGNKPVLPVLAFFPQQPVAPLAIEPADVAAVGLDFVPNSFVGGVVKKNAVLLAREGDFGFSGGNGKPEAGHDVELVNFTKADNPHELQLSRFAFNCAARDQVQDTKDGLPRCKGESEQAFAAHLHGINRPTTIRFGPDGAAYLVDYGAVRDFGVSDPDTKFANGLNAPLVQIPGTGVIWKITRVGGDKDDD